MKFIFFVLLSLNAIFFLWESLGLEHPRSTSDQALRQIKDPSIDRIVLVTEASEANDLPGITTNQRPADGMNPPSENQDSQVFQLFGQPLTGPVEQFSESLIADLYRAAVTRQITGYRSGPLDDPESGSAIPAPEGLVENNGPAREPIPSDIDSAAVADPNVVNKQDLLKSKVPDEKSREAVNKPKKSCYELGPRASSASFAQIAKFLKKTGVNPVFKTQNINQETGYFVYFPAAESFEISKANAEKLKDRGLRDILLIPNGPDRGNISLGFFKSLGPAEILKKQLEAKNISTRIQTKWSERTGYSIVFEWPSGVEQLPTGIAGSGFDGADLIAVDAENCVF